MIKTDFSKVERLLLIYPAGIIEDQYDYNALIPLYDELISLVPEDIEVILLCKSPQPISKFNKLRQNLKCVVIDKLQTIWLRDIAGFNCGDSIVKPIFRPKYYKGSFRKANTINRQMEVIHKILRKKLVKIPIIWDGGNLVTNGKFGLITDRLFEDNPRLQETEISEMIENHLHIKPIFVHQPSNDPLAHLDGYLAFIDEQTAVVGNYPDSWYEYEKKYVEKLSRLLAEQGIEVVHISENPEDKFYFGTNQAGGIPSAKGIFVNFLQINGLYIVPEYSLETDDEGMDYNLQARKTLETFGKVISINCDELGRYSGVLHCISFCD
jgi:agmatine/peptidylarginine deiminase